MKTRTTLYKTEFNMGKNHRSPMKDRNNQISLSKPKKFKRHPKRKNKISRQTRQSETYRSLHPVGRRNSSNFVTYTQNGRLFYDIYARVSPYHRNMPAISTTNLTTSVHTDETKKPKSSLNNKKKNDNKSPVNIVMDSISSRVKREEGLNAIMKLNVLANNNSPKKTISIARRKSKMKKAKYKQTSNIHKKLKRELGIDSISYEHVHGKRLASLNAAAIMNACSTSSRRTVKSPSISGRKRSVVTLPCRENLSLNLSVTVEDFDDSITEPMCVTPERDVSVPNVNNIIPLQSIPSLVRPPEDAQLQQNSGYLIPPFKGLCPKNPAIESYQSQRIIPLGHDTYGLQQITHQLVLVSSSNDSCSQPISQAKLGNMVTPLATQSEVTSRLISQTPQPKVISSPPCNQGLTVEFGSNQIVCSPSLPNPPPIQNLPPWYSTPFAYLPTQIVPSQFVPYNSPQFLIPSLPTPMEHPLSTLNIPNPTFTPQFPCSVFLQPTPNLPTPYFGGNIPFGIFSPVLCPPSFVPANNCNQIVNFQLNNPTEFPTQQFLRSPSLLSVNQASVHPFFPTCSALVNIASPILMQQASLPVVPHSNFPESPATCINLNYQQLDLNTSNDLHSNHQNPSQQIANSVDSNIKTGVELISDYSDKLHHNCNELKKTVVNQNFFCPGDNFEVVKSNEQPLNNSMNVIQSEVPPDSHHSFESHKCVSSASNTDDAWIWEGSAFEKLVFPQIDSPPILCQCYPAIRHGRDGIVIYEKDNVLLCSGPNRSHPPHVAKITALYLDKKTGTKMMALLWYYRPEHLSNALNNYFVKNELYASRHRDANPVDCIEDKAFVLSVNAYARFMAKIKCQQSAYSRKPLNSIVPQSRFCILHSTSTSVSTVNVDSVDCDLDSFKVPTTECEKCLENTSLANVFFCRGVYDYKLKRVSRSPFFGTCSLPFMNSLHRNKMNLSHQGSQQCTSNHESSDSVSDCSNDYLESKRRCQTPNIHLSLPIENLRNGGHEYLTPKTHCPVSLCSTPTTSTKSKSRIEFPSTSSPLCRELEPRDNSDTEEFNLVKGSESNMNKSDESNRISTPIRRSQTFPSSHSRRSSEKDPLHPINCAQDLHCELDKMPIFSKYLTSPACTINDTVSSSFSTTINSVNTTTTTITNISHTEHPQNKHFTVNSSNITVTQPELVKYSPVNTKIIVGTTGTSCKQTETPSLNLTSNVTGLQSKHLLPSTAAVSSEKLPVTAGFTTSSPAQVTNNLISVSLPMVTQYFDRSVLETSADLSVNWGEHGEQIALSLDCRAKDSNIGNGNTISTTITPPVNDSCIGSSATSVTSIHNQPLIELAQLGDLNSKPGNGLYYPSVINQKHHESDQPRLVLL